MTGQPWQASFRADRRAAALADRHYNRQSVGSAQFVPPGRCVVLRTADAGAVWVTSWPFPEFTKHRWAGAWVNSLFRRESGPRASDLIRAAVAATRAEWEDVPALGMVSFVRANAVRSINPGCCYLAAGFERDGTTEGGLLAFRLRPERMPDPLPAMGTQPELLAAVSS